MKWVTLGILYPHDPNCSHPLSWGERQSRILRGYQKLAMACQALLLYSVWVATPETVLWLIQGCLPTKWVDCSHLTTPLDTLCHLVLGRGGDESTQENFQMQNPNFNYLYSISISISKLAKYPALENRLKCSLRL